LTVLWSFCVFKKIIRALLRDITKAGPDVTCGGSMPSGIVVQAGQGWSWQALAFVLAVWPVESVIDRPASHDCAADRAERRMGGVFEAASAACDNLKLRAADMRL
jgi:hypothetical protein